VAWGTNDFFLKNGLATPYQSAPELCVEILSNPHSKQEITEKINLYLQQGAKEVWTCHHNGNVEIYNLSGKIPNSSLFDNLPKKFEYNSVPAYSQPQF